MISRVSMKANALIVEIMITISLDKNYGTSTLTVYPRSLFLAVNKIITNKTQNIFYLIAEHSRFIIIML